MGRRAASGGKEYTEISMDPNSPSSPEDAVEQETSRKFGSLRRTPTIVRYNVDKKRGDKLSFFSRNIPARSNLTKLFIPVVARARSLETESQRAHRIRMKTVPRADLEKPLTVISTKADTSLVLNV